MKIENISVMNFENAFRGMRNPLDSWAKSDSEFCKIPVPECACCETRHEDRCVNGFFIGDADLGLACRLIKGGTEHRKFLRQIFVSMDITAPLYWWSEMDTYKIGTTANSCSTMHTLSKYPITKEMFEIDSNITEDPYWNIVTAHLESLRIKYNDTKDYRWFRLMKQELPTSFLQKRTWTCDYETLMSIYRQRQYHRLTEWSDTFIDTILELPYMKTFLAAADLLEISNDFDTSYFLTGED